MQYNTISALPPRSLNRDKAGESKVGVPGRVEATSEKKT
jgi:hypothetical protein